MPPIFPGIGYTCFGVDRIRPGIRSGYRDAGSFALDDVLLAVPVEHDDVALLDESEPHRLGGLPKRRVKRNGVEAVRLPVRTALLQNHEYTRVNTRGVRLPVRTALLQNTLAVDPGRAPVRLPVRTALLQNLYPELTSKDTVRLPVRTALLQNSR